MKKGKVLGDDILNCFESGHHRPSNGLEKELGVFEVGVFEVNKLIEKAKSKLEKHNLKDPSMYNAEAIYHLRLALEALSLRKAKNEI